MLSSIILYLQSEIAIKIFHKGTPINYVDKQGRFDINLCQLRRGIKNPVNVAYVMPSKQIEGLDFLT